MIVALCWITLAASGGCSSKTGDTLETVWAGHDLNDADERTAVREEVIRIGRNDTEALVTYIKSIVESDVEKAQLCLGALGVIDAERLLALIEELYGSRNPTTRGLAVFSLKHSDSAKGDDTLVKAMTDPDEGVRLVAYSSMRPVSAKQHRAWLIARFGEEGSVRCKSEILFQLALIDDVEIKSFVRARLEEIPEEKRRIIREFLDKGR